MYCKSCTCPLVHNAFTEAKSQFLDEGLFYLKETAEEIGEVVRDEAYRWGIPTDLTDAAIKGGNVFLALITVVGATLSLQSAANAIANKQVCRGVGHMSLGTPLALFSYAYAYWVLVK